MPPLQTPFPHVDQDQVLRQVVYSSLYRSLSADLQEQMRVSIALYTREQRLEAQFSDYSFIVFPMAKAYEGFLKQYLFQLRLLSPEAYHDRRFRIGRALNPDLRNHQRDEQWLYDDVVRLCSDELGQLLWSTWLQCRNHVFHYFPATKQGLSLKKAGEYLLVMVITMTEAQSCQDDRRSWHNRTTIKDHQLSSGFSH